MVECSPVDRSSVSKEIPPSGRETCDIVIVGSGFAGSILARVLCRQGFDVILVERDEHPRFALGESSTPLAAISLERLAARYGLEDLAQLAAYGRWQRHLPQLECGLKRGFTFYHHQAGQPFRNGEANQNRLLVAASPAEDIADCHWLRSSVDKFLVDRAVAEGVRLRDRTDLQSFREMEKGVTVTGCSPRGEYCIEASFLVDASGSNGFLRSQLPIDCVPIARAPTARVQGGSTKGATSLLFGHFRGVRDFVDVASGSECKFPLGPYADSSAAVHHTFEGGWLYLLPFDHGVVSAGLLSRSGGPMPSEPTLKDWKAALAPWPSLLELFRRAQVEHPLSFVPRLQSRLQRSAGARWLLLPQCFAFSDPLFSTGMAWSLVAVERVAHLFARDQRLPSPEGLGRYSQRLEVEADQISDLVEAAWASFGDFDALRAVSALYFAAASYQELRQRLVDPDPENPWAWEGFLGATDPVIRSFVREGCQRAEASSQRQAANLGEANGKEFGDWVSGAIADRNAIGLMDSQRRNLYPVDLEVVLRKSSVLGLSRPQVESRLHRLHRLHRLRAL